ncbi:fructose-bisphosphate aldolase class I [Candidatus Peribacteria bacterium]|jgi:fructose-bisphosphate aldolase, class I|nr:fructose-bisphosphate aldolase class I [Candidatus Peribacteria bacterium]MBT4021570.1 fructose-bisphosphate aldolase class I [Candidatus Peribacteria bacterium]MBT4240730.1 fructose-bisphosphate aldolase class I [Candidatus Peribacteria bacterium]MBT4474284.1 fructose-bisphosphate aldolase class I [Candidatus Peribacteria bacterium]
MPDTARISDNIQKILAPGKGILAADESTGTIQKRFDSINVENTEENRIAYRNMLFTTGGYEEFISGVILFDETIDQKGESGQTFSEMIAASGVVPGIKNDEGKEEHPNFGSQTITRGLKGLGKRLENWTERSNGTLGFTKWRQVVLVEPEPNAAFLDYAMSVMAEQAAWVIDAGYVPICEPEILMDGSHTQDQCASVTERTLSTLYKKFEEQGVDPALTILKTNMVLSGKETKKDTPEEVAGPTVQTFQNSVPASMPGVVFLSGGQSSIQSTENLNACAKVATSAPWVLSFSYGRALQEDALKAWGGSKDNYGAGQSAFLHRAKMNGLAQKEEYEGE